MKYFTFSLLIAFATPLFAQENSPIEVKVFFAWQMHDKRFYGGERGGGDWGTSQFGVSINKTVAGWERFGMQVGAGYARETNTWFTPYDHCFDKRGGFCTYNLAYLDKYNINLVQTPVTLKYKLHQNFNLNLSIIPQVYVYKHVKGYGETSQFKPGLYSIEFNPGIEYAIWRLHFNMGFRLFQLKTIDKVYLYGHNFLSKHPGYLDRTFDTYNPLKLLFGIGYDINGK